jgi:hypothetical protein
MQQLTPRVKDKKHRARLLLNMTELCATATDRIRPQFVQSTAAAIVILLSTTQDTAKQALRSCRHALAQILRVAKEEAIRSVITTVAGAHADTLHFEEKARYILLGYRKLRPRPIPRSNNSGHERKPSCDQPRRHRKDLSTGQQDRTMATDTV